MNNFLKKIPGFDNSLFYFLYYRSLSIISISEIKSKQVFDIILGKMSFE